MRKKLATVCRSGGGRWRALARASVVEMAPPGRKHRKVAWREVNRGQGRVEEVHERVWAYVNIGGHRGSSARTCHVRLR